MTSSESETEKRMTFLDTVWNKRTILEKITIILLPACLIVIIALSIAIGIANQKGTKKQEPCVTKECIHTAEDIVSSMNLSVDPCHDFYEYACGSWIDDKVIVDKSVDRFSNLADNLNYKFYELLGEVNDSLPSHFRYAQQYYNSCMDYDGREHLMSELFYDLQRMGGWPLLMDNNWKNDTHFDWLHMIETMLSIGYDNSILAAVGMTHDNKNTSIIRVVVTQPLLGMSDKDWFGAEHIVELYKMSIFKYASTLCRASNCTTPVDTMKEQINDAVDFEVQIAASLHPDSYYQDVRKTYNLITIGKLQELAPGIDWLRWIKIYFPNEKIRLSEPVLVPALDVLKNISALIEEITHREGGNKSLANYMVYRQIIEAGSHLDLDFSRIKEDLTAYITGFIALPDLWAECVSQTSAVFEFSLASIYIEREFPPQKKKAILQLVEKIRNELKVVLQSTTWMDNATKSRAIEKLGKISVMAAYPNDLLNVVQINKWYFGLEVSESYYENFKKANQFLLKKQLTGLREPVDKNDWKNFPSSLFESNAFYLGEQNSIFIPLGVASGWFFELNAPDFVNYGRMGFLLGHELSHAFDDDGSLMDGNGNLVNWWEPNTEEQFDLEKKCLISIFNNFSFNISGKVKKVNGTQTLGENIADDSGIKEAYQAFKKVTAEKKTTITLPGIKLTQNQLFWVNYAMVWCEKSTPTQDATTIEYDEHALNKLRVLSPLSNSEGFIQDFKCKPGSKMNPTKPKCHVFGK